MQDTILIIDESRHYVQTLINRLRNYGYDLIYSGISAADGIEKLNIISPDIVLLDTRINGADGFNLCRTIKNSYPHVKVIMMIGLEERFNKQQVIDAGADDFAIKTFDCRPLITAIKRSLFLMHGSEI